MLGQIAGQQQYVRQVWPAIQPIENRFQSYQVCFMNPFPLRSTVVPSRPMFQMPIQSRRERTLGGAEGDT